ncbi:MAG: glycoside hydrolase family 2 [Pseudoxanthomonas sp.]
MVTVAKPSLERTSPMDTMGVTRRTLTAAIVVMALLALGIAIAALAIGGRPDPPALRAAAVTLAGDWRFRVGDDPRWAQAALDDSHWEMIDLTAPPGSHDGDVGLPDYVSGWMAHGHPGHRGYAWYRRSVAVPAEAGPWALLGPTAVDDAYAVYWNGRRLGGSGRLDAPPRPVGTRPMLFRLPADAAGARSVLAVRVYMQPGGENNADAGGLHTAPLLAPQPVAEALHGVQWRRTIAGYIVDVIEPIAMLTLACLALVLRRRSDRKNFLACVAAALALVAARRVGNPIYYWTDLQSLTTNLWLAAVVWTPLGLAAWTFAWNRWCGRPWRTIDVAATLLVLAGIVGALAEWAALIRAARIGSIVLFALIAVRIVRDGPMRTLALATMASILIGLFAGEVSAMGVPGIWFPFGIGVSRTQYAYAIATFLLGLLIVRTLPLEGMKPETNDRPAGIRRSSH